MSRWIDAVAVGVVERRGDFGRDPDRVGDRKLLLAGQPVAERLALDVGHDVEEEAVGRTGIEQRKDVRMLEVRGRPDLGQKPVGADHRRELGPEHLDRDLADVLQVLGEIHRGHAAGAELALDAIAIGQGGRETSEGLGHGSTMLEEGLNMGVGAVAASLDT